MRTVVWTLLPVSERALLARTVQPLEGFKTRVALSGKGSSAEFPSSTHGYKRQALRGLFPALNEAFGERIKLPNTRSS